MLRSAKQFCKAGLATDPACPFCGQCEEDVSHIFLACVAWDHIRLKFPEVSLQWLHDAAACSRSCAVPLLPDGVVQSNEKLWTRSIGNFQTAVILGLGYGNGGKWTCCRMD